jgi:zinc protease
MQLSMKVSLLNLFVLVLLVIVPSAEAFEIKQVTSDRGIKAWLVEDHKNPLITLQVLMNGGSSLDPKNKDGLAYLVSGLLDEGAGSLDSKSFQSSLEENSISLSFNARTDTFSGTMSTLTETSDEAFRLLRLSLNSPRFDQDPMLRVTNQILAGLRASKENPNRIAGRLWWELAFPKHAYGKQKKGNEKTLKLITQQDLKGFVKRTFSQDNLTVSVVGDITPERLSTVLDQVFGDLPLFSNINALDDAELENVGQTVIIERNIPQSVVIFGHKGIRRNDPDWYAATILFEILAGGFGSRLTEEIREKRGLTYGVSAYPLPLNSTGLIIGNISTVNERVGESIGLIKSIWKKFAEEGPTGQEMRNAKDYINGSFALRFTNSKSIAAVLTALQRFELGSDYISRRPSIINRITMKDLKRVAKRIFNSADLTFSVVGMPKGIVSTMKAHVSN